MNISDLDHLKTIPKRMGTDRYSQVIGGKFGAFGSAGVIAVGDFPIAITKSGAYSRNFGGIWHSLFN